jgi:hypothetical protein
MTRVGDPRIRAEREREVTRPLTGQPAAPAALRGLPLVQTVGTVHLLTLREASPQSAERMTTQPPPAAEAVP